MRAQRTRPGRRRAVLVAIALLGACGGGDEASSTDTTGSLLQGLAGPQGSEEIAALELRIEEGTAACMRALGWEYTPVDYSQTASEVDEDLFATPYSFQEKYGYGIATFIGLSPEEMPFGVVGGDEFVDPNVEYVESLSDAERQQYYEDLYGNTTFDEQGNPVDEAATEGCNTRARNDVMGDYPLADPELSADLEALYEGLTDDPRILEAQERWSACMRDAGFEFASQDEIYPYLQGKADALTGMDSGVAEGAEEVVVGGDPAEGSEGDGGFEEWAPPTSKAPDPDALEALQDEEMAIARADIACQKEHTEQVFAAVMREREQAFIDAHPELADRLADDGS